MGTIWAFVLPFIHKYSIKTSLFFLLKTSEKLILQGGSYGKEISKSGRMGIINRIHKNSRPAKTRTYG